MRCRALILVLAFLSNIVGPPTFHSAARAIERGPKLTSGNNETTGPALRSDDSTARTQLLTRQSLPLVGLAATSGRSVSPSHRHFTQSHWTRTNRWTDPVSRWLRRMRPHLTGDEFPA